MTEFNSLMSFLITKLLTLSRKASSINDLETMISFASVLAEAGGLIMETVQAVYIVGLLLFNLYAFFFK